MSGKSPADAAIPVLAFSGRAERALLGPGWRKPGWNPPIRGVQVHTEGASKKPKWKFRLIGDVDVAALCVSGLRLHPQMPRPEQSHSTSCPGLSQVRFQTFSSARRPQDTTAFEWMPRPGRRSSTTKSSACATVCVEAVWSSVRPTSRPRPSDFCQFCGFWSATRLWFRHASRPVRSYRSAPTC